jgi:DUF4097 and DUF4098 domain-containing protein YvlB
MNKSLTLGAKLGILIGLALIFAATLIALSLHEHHRSSGSYTSSDYTGGNNTSTMNKTFSVKSGGRLVMDVEEGDVKVTGTDRDEVTIRVTESGDPDRIAAYHLDFDQSGNEVTVRGTHERKYFHLWDDNSLQVNFEIEVPKSFNLHLETSGGDLKLHDIEGELFGETSGGNLDVDRLKGKLNLSTSGGNVDFTELSGDMTLKTSGGNIQGSNATGPLTVETSGGNIRLSSLDGKIFAETSGGDIRVDASGNKGIELSTSGGSVIVNLPKNTTATVRAETTGGDVTCDFPFLGKIQEGSFNGSINGGGEMIRLESSGGDIAIHAKE